MAKIKIEDIPLDDGDQDFQRVIKRLAKKRSAKHPTSKKTQRQKTSKRRVARKRKEVSDDFPPPENVASG